MEFNSDMAGKIGDPEIPRVKDIMDMHHLNKVLVDANSLGVSASNRYFTQGARKAPITKQNLQRFISMSSMMGHMQAVESLMSFLESAEIIDGFDPSHDLI